MIGESFVAAVLARANRLRFKNLFFLVCALLGADLLIPDFIPMIDEIILGILAIILANWKQERARKLGGVQIEGEVINNDRED